jgi:hypothetical protein
MVTVDPGTGTTAIELGGAGVAEIALQLHRRVSGLPPMAIGEGDWKSAIR